MEYGVSNRRLLTKLRTARLVSGMLAVVSIVFLILYVQTADAQKRSYNDLYMGSMKNAASIMAELSRDEFDYTTKYNEVCAELNVCTKMVALVGLDEAVQKAVNELYYSFIKLPNQVKPNLNAVHTALLVVINGDTTGYAQIQALVDGFDKLDY